MTFGLGDGKKRERTYYTAVCSDCGKECEVPFRPTQGRTVYCKECFKKHAPPLDDRRRRF